MYTFDDGDNGAWVADYGGYPISKSEALELRRILDQYLKRSDAEILNEQKRIIGTHHPMMYEQLFHEALPAQYRKEKAPAAPKKPKTGHIYLIKGEGTPWFKIGHSAKPVTRTSGIGTKSPFKCTVLRSIVVANTKSAESALHAIFSDKRAEGEWFALLPADVDWLMTTTAATADEFNSEARP